MRDAAARRVAEHGDTRVAERLDRLRRAVARAVVDDDHLELDAPLGERQAHRVDDDARTVARRDHDRHGVSHGRPPGGEQDVRREHMARMPATLLDGIERRAHTVEADVRRRERGPPRAREATAELLLAGVQERAGEQRPGDGATAVLDDDDVVPAVEEVTQRARRVAVLDDLAVVLPDHGHGHEHPAAGPDDPRSSRTPCAGSVT